jgi:hypothetical protein
MGGASVGVGVDVDVDVGVLARDGGCASAMLAVGGWRLAVGDFNSQSLLIEAWEL